jgi:hypothetical protein
MISTVIIDGILIYLLSSYLFEGPDLYLKLTLALVTISSIIIAIIKITTVRADITDKPKNYITVTKDTIISIKLALYLNIVEIINLFIVIVCSLYYVSNIQSSQYENVVEEIILSMGSALMFFMVAILSIIVIFYKIFVIRNKEKVIKQCNNEGSIEEKTLKRLSSKQINIIIILAYAFVGFFKFIETDFISFIPIALLMVLEFMEIKNSRSIHI